MCRACEFQANGDPFEDVCARRPMLQAFPGASQFLGDAVKFVDEACDIHLPGHQGLVYFQKFPISIHCVLLGVKYGVCDDCRNGLCCKVLPWG